MISKQKNKTFVYTILIFAISVAVLLENMNIERADININPAELKETIRHWIGNNPLICLNMTGKDLDYGYKIVRYYNNMSEVASLCAAHVKHIGKYHVNSLVHDTVQVEFTKEKRLEIFFPKETKPSLAFIEFMNDFLIPDNDKPISSIYVQAIYLDKSATSNAEKNLNKVAEEVMKEYGMDNSMRPFTFFRKQQMERKANLERQIEEEMKNDIRISLTQERRNTNNLRIAFIVDNDYKLANGALVAVKKDETGVTLISALPIANLTEESMKKVIQYGVSRALGLKLKGEILEKAGGGKSQVFIESLETFNQMVWKREVAKELMKKNMNNLLQNLEVLKSNSEIVVTPEIKERVEKTYAKFLEAKSMNLTLDESLNLQFQIEEELWEFSTTKKLTSPGNFDFMFLLGIYAPLIASLQFQFFSALQDKLKEYLKERKERRKVKTD